MSRNCHSIVMHWQNTRTHTHTTYRNIPHRNTHPFSPTPSFMHISFTATTREITKVSSAPMSLPIIQLCGLFSHHQSLQLAITRPSAGDNSVSHCKALLLAWSLSYFSMTLTFLLLFNSPLHLGPRMFSAIRNEIQKDISQYHWNSQKVQLRPTGRSLRSFIRDAIHLSSGQKEEERSHGTWLFGCLCKSDTSSSSCAYWFGTFCS